MIFAHLDHEGRVQLNDKTRFDASKCFNSKGSADITTLTIKAGASASAIDCFNADPNEWFLDWAFSAFAIDVDSSNSQLLFSVGSTDYTVNLSSGSYTLSQYATEIASKMTASGAGTFSGSVSNSKITVSANVSFDFKSSAVQLQGFFPINKPSSSITGDLVQYGKRLVTVAIGNGTDEATASVGVDVYTEQGDALFSTDSLLMSHEPDILKWVKQGRASFKDVHRRAQDLIIMWLDKNGFVNVYGEKFSKMDIIDVSEVRDWATYLALRLIFEGISNSADDVFSVKAKGYSALEIDARQRAILRIDVNKDGSQEIYEGFSIHSGSLFRR